MAPGTDGPRHGQGLRRVLDDLPIEYRDRYHALCLEPPEPLEQLRDELLDYLVTVKQVGALASAVDLPAAERVGRSLNALLAQAGSASDEVRMLVTGAIRYFVREEDDEEITGVLGFDDDAQVVNAVARALGRPELVVPLSRP